VSAACHVEPPDAVGGFAYQLGGFIVVRLQAAHPVAEGHGVVLAQAFEVAGLEAGVLREVEHLAGGDQLAVREDVFVDELAFAPDLAQGNMSSRRSPGWSLSLRQM